MFWDEIVVFELFWHFPTGTLLFNSQTSFLNIKTVADRLTLLFPMVMQHYRAVSNARDIWPYCWPKVFGHVDAIATLQC